MWYKSKYLHLNNSFYYNTEVLTRPGAKGCNYGHSTWQETGLSVLPVDVTKHTRMLKTGHHVPYTQHHYDLSFTERHTTCIKGSQGESMKDLLISKANLLQWLKGLSWLLLLHILRQVMLKSNSPDYKGQITKKWYKHLTFFMHGVTIIGTQQMVNRGKCQNIIFLLLL